MSIRVLSGALLMLVGCCAIMQAADYYVAPTGSAITDGSITRPWDLVTALNHPASVKPGDTVWLRDGTYKGTFISKLKGTAAAPIILRGYPGERAVLDGTRVGQTVKNVTVLDVQGAYVWLRDFEITNSDPQRYIPVSGSNPPERRGTGLDISVTGVKVINVVVHDAGQGISSYAVATDAEIYGTLIYNNGWDAPDRGHGHGLYAQNNSGSKIVSDNIFLQTFGDTMHVYGSSAAYLRNFNITGNVMYNGRLLFGGNTPIENMQFNDNMTYNHRLEFGYGGIGNYGLSMSNNYLMNGVTFLGWQNFTANNNTIYASVNDGSMRSVVVTPPAGVPWSSYKINSNTYFQSNPTGLDFRASNLISWNDWKKLGYDTAGSYTSTTTKRGPTGNKVFIRNNKYDPDRFTIVIYNWSLGSTVPVDLSSIMKPGESYELRNVLDYYNDVTTATYSGGSIFVPMVSRTMALPVGYSTAVPGASNTFPAFGTFVLIRKINASVQVSPATVNLLPSATQQFTATVTNTTNTAVRWSISPPVGTISATGLYTAPASIPSGQTITVLANSVANGAVVAKATVQLIQPVLVTVNAAASVLAGTPLQVTATVTGTTNTAVTWSVSPVGTISVGGLYTPPASVSLTTPITITARSVANPSAYGTATVSILSALGQVLGSNGLVNPGFESGTTGWVGAASPGRMLSTIVHSGTKSLMIAADTVARNITQDLIVVPGKTMSFSGWMKTQNVPSGAPAAFNLIWLTAAGSVAKVEVMGSVSGSPAWTVMNKSVVVPSTAATVRVEAVLPANPTTAKVFVDDVSLK